MPEEIWKPVVGYEELYAISDQGRVKRLAGTSQLASKADYVLSLAVNTSGYFYVMLCSNGRHKNRLVHHLVLEAFQELCPSDKECCNHKNGNKQDNCHANLEWTTILENTRHAYKYLGLGRACGEDNGSARLTEADVRFIRKHAHATSQMELARRFSVDRTTIWRVLTKRSWKHVE